jgi:hypothetical protein
MLWRVKVAVNIEERKRLALARFSSIKMLWKIAGSCDTIQLIIELYLFFYK